MLEKNNAPYRSNLSAQLRLKQRWLLVGLSVLALVLLVGFYELTKPTPVPHTRPQTPGTFVNPIGAVGDDAWRTHQEEQLQAMHAHTKALQQNIKALKAQFKKQAGLLQAQAQQFAKWQRRYMQQSQASVIAPTASPQKPSHTTTMKPPMPMHVKIHTVHLIQYKKHVKNKKNYVPAGSFVRAVLLSGLDAPAGANAQTRPLPVLLRLTGKGTLPNRAYARTKGCFITGAGYGGLSANRVYIRTEALSCTLKNGHIIDVPVEGTIVGPDGKDGIHGTVVRAEGAMLARATASGLLSGLGGALAQTFTVQSVSPLGHTASINGKHFLQYGLAQGAASGMGQLAHYYIKRAQAYQPVVEVSAGVPVDILFLKGFSFGAKPPQGAQGPTVQAPVGAPIYAQTPAFSSTVKQHNEGLL